mgnify:CR=1 FL=1
MQPLPDLVDLLRREVECGVFPDLLPVIGRPIGELARAQGFAGLRFDIALQVVGDFTRQIDGLSMLDDGAHPRVAQQALNTHGVQLLVLVNPDRESGGGHNLPSKETNCLSWNFRL